MQCVGIVCGKIFTVNTICGVRYEQYHVSVSGALDSVLKTQKGVDL